MPRMLILILALSSACVYAEDIPSDEAILKEIARRVNEPIESVRSDYNEGCSSGVNIPMQRCAYYHSLATDIAMNNSYRKLKTQLANTPSLPKLIKAQKAWIAFRDATCNYESSGYSGGDGSGHSVAYSGCVDQVTELRNKKLQEYLACKNSGCPGEW